MKTNKNYVEELIDLLPPHAEKVAFLKRGKEIGNEIKDEIASLEKQLELVKKLVKSQDTSESEISKPHKVTGDPKKRIPPEINGQIGKTASEYAKSHLGTEFSPANINDELISKGIDIKTYVDRPTAVIASILRKLDNIEKKGLNRYQYKEGSI
jgi:hypothetical protein